jgi:acetyl coenzyme A synthetase (ADP forming)-like protein
MTLDHILKPRSIAVIGASRTPGTVGNGILKNLLQGGVFKSQYSKPFKGKIYAVNPKAKKILGQRSFPSIEAVPGQVDLAIIAVPSKVVPGVMQGCVKKGVRGSIIISAGFGELGDEGRKLQEEIVRIARAGKIRIVGPNCLGVLRMENRMNASFAPTMPPRGNVAFISQSGALADSVIDWAIDNRYGFSNVISYGNKADLDAHDFMEWLADDPETRVITLYIEGLRDGAAFIKAAKSVVKKKPVIALKAGRGEAGSKAISSHTGSMAGSYKIYEAAFKQSGVILADTVEELFDLAKVLAEQPATKANSVAIVTNGGGCGVLTADYCEELGVKLAELTASTIKKLDSSGKMHPAYSRRNPLDIVGDALPERYKVAIDTLMAEPYVGGMIVLQTLQTMTDPVADAKIVVDAHHRHPTKPIICVYMGGKFSRKGIQYLEDHCIPDYNDPKKAAKAMWALVERGRQVSTIKPLGCRHKRV